jgi:hypothetical protein
MTGHDDRAKGIVARTPTWGAIRSALCALLPLVTLLPPAALLGTSGCGTAITANQNFRERVIGIDGQEIWIEDIREINDNADLDVDAKRQAYRDLGIVDADLIEALLTV